MQQLQHRIFLEGVDVTLEVCLRANDAPQIEQLGSTSHLDCFLRDSPRIDILSGLRRLDRKKRLAFVFECGPDWSLVETIEQQKLLRRRFRTGSLVELFQREEGGESFRMALLFVKLLKDAAHFDQLSHSRAFAVAQL